MSFSIRTNIASLTAQNNLGRTQSHLATSMNRLSSGERITCAADDAAGLGISVNLEAQIKSYTQAGRNANDGISLVQTAEGSLNEVSNILARMRELAMQSASDGVGATQRGYINTEVRQLQKELNRINVTSEYNGNNFFQNGMVLTFQVGIRGTENDAINVDTTKMKVDSNNLGVGEGEVDLGKDIPTSQEALAKIDAAIDKVSDFRAQLGAAGNRFQSVSNTIQNASQNLSSADSRIRDVDVANETSELSRTQVLSQAGVAVLAQANQTPQLALKLLS